MDVDSARDIYNPFNIVPLYEPYKLASISAPPAKLTYRGGALLTSVKIHTLYFGKAWRVGKAQELVTQIDAFFDYIVSSPLITQLSEYCVPKYKIGFGKHVGSTVVDDIQSVKLVSDRAIRKILLKKANTDGLYFIYLPPGVAVKKAAGMSCSLFCGYHDAINEQIFYAVMPYSDCPECAGDMATFDALTCTSSHELCEAITDPIPGTGWYDDAHGEIGDMCAWKTKKLDKYIVQLEWSNKFNSCM